MVREAYSLLRQSIVHVEQDNVEIDDDDEEDMPVDRELPTRNAQESQEESQDVMMTDESQTQIDSGPTAGETSIPSGARTSTPHHHATTPALVPAAPAKPKRKMIISHDKYVTLQSLVILHLQEVEAKTKSGMEREDLIDWYLEHVEEGLQSIEDIEYERELMTKLLRKLVKVRARPCNLLRC
jgi:DNA replication licensing factor MCM6